ncbi:SGNH/GDSL hydrolase family protein [Xanthobacter sp. TB0139]|uniref:SGNH/GDSL hydrolase family protein n=1 Tax=Xanthobacter sp. TB0139 TaxID=3459178 RepID=UPI00403949B6
MFLATTSISIPAHAQATFDPFFFLRPFLSQPKEKSRPAPRRWKGEQAPKKRRSSSPSGERTKRVKKALPVTGVVYSTAQEAKAGRQKDPSQFILVLGDAMGGALASGLADAYLGEQDRIAIIGRISGQGGFLPEPENWKARLAEDVKAADPNVIILAMGAHDLKAIDDTGFKVSPFSDRWLELYSRRVDKILAAARGQVGRVVVVGLAPVSNDLHKRDYVRLNDVLRTRAVKAGLPFVSVWDGFVDEAGNYFATGPAVDGQQRLLRKEDGVGFTRAGQRKLAFFVQKEVDRLLPSLAGPITTGQAQGEALILAGGPEKTGAEPNMDEAISELRAPLHRGIAPMSLKGRADHFTWPPPQGLEALPARLPFEQ